ncbi:SDR family oxidoreductase, partial [Candidatus Kuenenia stuttgartensis]|uniref:SDR family oxidoreductase n=1 Tax=Kuenenia stuttgartiensis TaxID=174633 RepID=UPI001469C498
KKQGIPLTVYRPSIIAGDSITGYTKNYDNIYVFAGGLFVLMIMKHERKSGNDQPIQGRHEVRPVSLRIPEINTAR